MDISSAAIRSWLNTSKNNVDNFGVKEKQDGQCAALLLFCPDIEDNCVDNHNISIVLTKQYRQAVHS